MEKAYKTKENTVKIGNKVKMELDGNRRLSLSIGNHNEGNLDLGVISCDAPLAKAILGRQVGEVVNYTAGGEVHSTRIIKVSNSRC